MCDKPTPVFVIGDPDGREGASNIALGDVDREVAKELFPSTARSGPAADPAALASDVAAFLSEGGGLRGVEVRSVSARSLTGMALASVADALSIVGAEGLLACVERRVTAGGDAAGDMAVSDALAMLMAASGTGDARIHACIAREGPLLRALLVLVAHGPADATRRSFAAMVLHQLSHSARWEAAARAVDALPDNDLKAVITTSSCGRWGPYLPVNVVSFLARCARNEAVLRRLLGPAKFLRVLVGLMGDDAAPENLRVLVVRAINGLFSAARSRGTADKEVLKTLYRPLQAAYECAHLPGASLFQGYLGSLLAPTLEFIWNDAAPTSAVASDIPRLVAAVRDGGPLARTAAGALLGMANQPALRAVALSAGVISALVTLLQGGDRSCCLALDALGNLVADAEGRAAFRATDAAARLMAVLEDANTCRLCLRARVPAGADAGLLSLALATTDMANLFNMELLPASALIGFSTAARVSRIARGGGDAAFQIGVILQVAVLRRANFDAMVTCGALRAALDAFVDAGASSSMLLFTMKSLDRAYDEAGTYVQDDVVLAAGSGVDRDCRQALARFLLLPANEDVLRRLLEIQKGADECAHHATSVCQCLVDPRMVGPQLSVEFSAHFARSA